MPDPLDPVALGRLRRAYRLAGLTEGDLAPTWLEQFAAWFAGAAGLTEPNAVVLSTADPGTGRPSSRTVLLKGVDDRGFVVFTNYGSRKAREALGAGYAALLFPWVDLERQVAVRGAVTRTSDEENAAYFATRPRGSQLGAWASRQSSVLPDRAALVARRAAVEARFTGGEVPTPPFWGGLRVTPDEVEFWQGRPDRLHDRLRYRREAEGWVVERLSP